MEKRIGFIGAGNMSSTIIRGLVKSFEGMNQSIYISNRTIKKAEELCNQVHINLCRTNVELAQNSDIIFLGVKPHMYDGVLREINSYVTGGQIIVSLAAGITTADIGQYFKEPMKIIRIMPNVPVSVGEGMIALSSNGNVTGEEIDFVVQLLSSVGKVDKIDEGLIDAVTTISGCSPAFIAMFVEALADGSVRKGMPRDKAYVYAAQTLIGTGKMILEKGLHPGELKDMVSSPGGVTIEGVYELEKRGFRNMMIEVVEACERKTKSMKSKKVEE